MRVSKAQVADNRAMILDSASRAFRAKGFDGVGIAELMRSAGLTNGAFYGHFKSKDDLMAQVCMPDRPSGPWAILAQDSSAAGLAAFVSAYLDPAHVRQRADGCLLAALAGDVARQIGPTRRRFTETLSSHLDLLAAAMPGPEAGRREAALATLAGLVGALVLARAVEPAGASDLPEIAAETLSNARRDPT